VWENELGGLAFAIGEQPESFVKWAPSATCSDLDAEAARLVWASRFTPVPLPLGTGRDALGSWMETVALPGDSAVGERWKSDPSTAVRAIGRGLRALHEALPHDGCPFSWSVDDRLADVRRRRADGALDPRRWHPEHQGLSVAEAVRLLGDPPAVDRVVVCHGDACAPNTLVTADGHWSGHVDLGALGLADRWADLAVATWSCDWNYGPGLGDALLDAYGVAPDPVRTRYYRLLWDLGP
jgi:kanamycin kinase